MNHSTLCQKWLAAKEGILKDQNLVYVSSDDSGVWYRCPCGGEHAARRFWHAEGYSKSLSPILTCFITQTQWLVTTETPADVIKTEEEKYFALLAKAHPLVSKVIGKMGTGEDAITFLHDTHGIPRDITQMVIGNH